MTNRFADLTFVRKLLAAVAIAAVGRADQHPAQSTPAMEFEAASVKSPSYESGGGVTVHFLTGGPGTTDPGLFRCMNCTAWDLVMKAYNVERYQVSGSGWLDNQLVINAKVPNSATKEQFQTMLQNLLAERLKLILHREKRDVQGYALAVGKNGPKLKEPAEEAPAQPAPGDRPKIALDENHFVIMTPGQPRNGIRTYKNGNLFSMGTGRASMEQLAVELTRGLRQPVVDATGLQGKYEFVLYWSLDLPVSPADTGVDLPAAGTPLPALSGALQKLGLKMERKTIPADVLVIDHIEKRPTEN